MISSFNGPPTYSFILAFNFSNNGPALSARQIFSVPLYSSSKLADIRSPLKIAVSAELNDVHVVLK